MKDLHIPPELVIAENQLYKTKGWTISNVEHEEESQAYSACTLIFCGEVALFRCAKITPKKTGSFVTLWKRACANGPTDPFDIADAFKWVIVSIRTNERLDQFIFPKMVLVAQGIVSGEKKVGKRGFRVYTPWDVTTSMTAKKNPKMANRVFLLCLKVTAFPGEIYQFFAQQFLFSKDYLYWKLLYV